MVVGEEMAPGILEIAKAKDEEEDLDYLEIEIYKDLEFWKGLVIPIVVSFPLAFLFWLLFDTGVKIYSCFCFFFLWILIGFGLGINAQIREGKSYSFGSYISSILGIIIGIITILWVINGIANAWTVGYG